jgi:drug/metabolite transporter (DMT)-like permease
MWYLFALLSACSSTIRRAGDKRLSHKLHHLTLGWAQQLCSLPIIILAQILFGRFFNPFTLGANFWLPTLLYAVALYPLFIYFYINAIKHGELSKVLPIQSLTPIFVMITARIFIGQTPTPLAVLGIFIVVVGIYILNLKGKYLHNPLKVFSGDKANAFMLASLVITAFAGVCDKVAIQASDPVYYTLVNTCISCAALFLLSTALKVNVTATLKSLKKPLLVSGTLAGTSFLLYVFALRTGPLAYVSTIKGTSILMGSVVGYIYFKERVTNVKIAALGLITIGSVLLGLAS